MAVETRYVGNIKGPKGDPGPAGTFASATAHSLPPEDDATVELGGTEDARSVSFGVPRGLPGTNAVANDEAFATYIQASGSDTNTALNSAFAAVDLVVDARRFCALDGTTDDGPNIQAMVDHAAAAGVHGAQLKFPAGTVFINSPIVLNDGDPDKWRSWIIEGSGRATRFELGPGLNEDFAFQVNTSGQSLPGPGKLVVRDLSVWGDYAAKGVDDVGDRRSFVLSHDTSTRFENLMVSSIAVGLRTTGYTDLVTIEKCIHRWNFSDGLLYDGQGSGDGLVISQVTTSPKTYVTARASLRQGARIQSCISGRFEFIRCDAVTVANHHADQHTPSGPDTDRAPFYVEDSSITFDRCWTNGSNLAPWLEVNDARGNNWSRISIEGCNFVSLHHLGQDPSIYSGFKPAVHVRSVHSNTSIEFRGNVATDVTSGTANKFPGVLELSSDIPAIRAAFAVSKDSVFSHSVLMNGARGWGFYPASGEAKNIGNVATPEISLVQSSSQLGNHPLETIRSYIAVAVLDEERELYSERSNQASITSTDSASAVGIDVTTIGQSPVTLRVWRNTNGGGFTEYADVGLGVKSVRIYDHGSEIAGMAWESTDVPPIPALGVSSAFPGVIMGGVATVRKSGQGAPSTGRWFAGDRCIVTDASAGEAVEYQCFSAGRPGGWAQIATRP